MRTLVAGAWRAFLGVQLVVVAGWSVLGCDEGQLIGEPCGGDDECVSGAVCNGGTCVAPIDLGRDPAPPSDAAAPDVADDVAQDAPEEAASDAPEEAAPDAPAEAEPDAPAEAASDAESDAAGDAADDAGDAGDAG